MRIAIIGAGAMGSVYTGLLADAGLDVWAVDAWAEHVDAIRRDGLHVSGASGERAPSASRPRPTLARPPPADLVVIVTKARDVGGRPPRPPATSSAPTAWSSRSRAASARPSAWPRSSRPERVMIGVVGGFGASIKAPGHAHHNGWEFVRLGKRGGGITPRLERVGKLWEQGG